MRPTIWNVLHAVFMGIGSLTSAENMPLPFSRVLVNTENNEVQGSDVLIAQTLLNRSPGFKIPTTGYYDEATAAAFTDFQAKFGLVVNGVFENTTATVLLSCCSRDGYVDAGLPASSYGKKYKIVVPLPSSNRSVEALASLYDVNNNFLRSFIVRAHGIRGDGTSAPWPDYGDGDTGLNEFSSNGNTPTGLSTLDLNSPEPADVEPEFGPYPVNRVVQGLEGNAGLLLSSAPSSIRTGILLHTGEWPGWVPGDDMPNSDGCLHAYPEDIKAIWTDLLSLGVEVRPNPYSSKNYPFVTQGILSVYLTE